MTTEWIDLMHCWMVAITLLDKEQGDWLIKHNSWNVLEALYHHNNCCEKWNDWDQNDQLPAICDAEEDRVVNS